MLGDQANQGHQADLGVDVHAGEAEEQRDQRTADRQWHGHQNHQRVAEALELRRQHQEDQRQRQAEGDIQGAAFLHVLARGAGIVEGKARRRLFSGDLPHGLDGIAHAHGREALDDRRVELLELVELGRPGAVMHFDQGRQRQHLPLAVLHVVAAQPVGVVAVGAFHLSDHLVAAAVDGEAVDLAFAQQGGQGAAEVFHGHAHLRGFLAVDLDHHFRLVEGQVDVEEGELARGLGPLLDPLGHLQQRLVVVWRVDHELEGQAFAGAGQRRQVEAEDLQAGDLAELGLHFRKDFHLGALALVPGLEQEAADAGLHAVEAVDLERRVVLGEFLEQGHELIGVGIQVIEVGRLRGGGHQEHDALVLVRCQFLLGKHQQQRDQAQHDGGKGQHHRAGVEGGVQGALVALLQTLENLVEAMGQARGVFLVAQQHRAHHRRQGQGDDAGDHHGTGQGQGKLLEQGAGQAFKKADGCIHRRQGDGH